MKNIKFKLLLLSLTILIITAMFTNCTANRTVTKVTKCYGSWAHNDIQKQYKKQI